MYESNVVSWQKQAEPGIGFVCVGGVHIKAYKLFF